MQRWSKSTGISWRWRLPPICTPRYCAADPEEGGRQAVAEAWRNLTAVGARPLALTDNLNFGNPEKPEVMGQFAAVIRGMASACEALNFPVVSGNVSLYNETEGRSILPTPAIGGLGVLDDAATAVGIALPPWLDIVLIGVTKGWLGIALAARDCRPGGGGASTGRSGRRASRRRFRPKPDCQRDGPRLPRRLDGGLLVAVAEMAMASGTGARLSAHPRDIPGHAFWFGEDQGRYVLAVPDCGIVLRAAEAVNVSAVRIGTSGGRDLTLPDGATISVEALRDAHARFFRTWMG